jgi:tetratricopeptide (TPR) repeat protein
MHAFRPNELPLARMVKPSGNVRLRRVLSWGTAILLLALALLLLKNLPPMAGAISIATIWIGAIVYFSIFNNLVETGFAFRRILEESENEGVYDTVDALKALRKRSLRRSGITAAIVEKLFYAGDFVGAKRQIGKRRIAKNAVRVIYLKGLIAQQEEDWEASIRCFKDVLRFDDSADVYVSLSYSYLSDSHYFDAENSLFKALERDPDNYYIYYYLGILYHRTGNAAESRKFFSFFLQEKNEFAAEYIIQEVQELMEREDSDLT